MSEQDLEDVGDVEDPKAALVALIVAATPLGDEGRSPAEAEAALYCGDPNPGLGPHTPNGPFNGRYAEYYVGGCAGAMRNGVVV